MLRVGEDPSIYKWDLEQLLKKADLTLAAEAKSALLCRQFMRGLPSTMRGRLLDHNPTPSLAGMYSFVQRYRAVEQDPSTSAGATTGQASADIKQLVGLMTELANQQKVLEDQMATSQQLHASAIKQQDRQNPGATRLCYQCGKQGHFPRECRNTSQTKDRSNVLRDNCRILFVSMKTTSL